MPKNDYNLMLRLPRDLKRAIERRAGLGRMSEFIRAAVEDRLTTQCTRCKGTGKLLRKQSQKVKAAN